MDTFFQVSPRRQKVLETTEEFLDKHGIRQREFAARADILAIPPVFSLRAGMTPARDQGSAGTCATFGCVSCLEYFHHGDLSEANVTDETERAFGDCSEGLAIGHVMQDLKERGAVAETVWPYDDSQICWANPPNTGGAARFAFSSIGVAFQRPTLVVVQQMRVHLNGDPTPIPTNFVPLTKNVLANGKRPVVLDVPVWWKSSGHFDAGWESGPDIQMPSPANLRLFLEEFDRMAAARNESVKSPEFVDGWHAIAICGYNDTTARFEFKNSWSEFWGDQGFGTIPYDYITQFSRIGMHGAV